MYFKVTRFIFPLFFCLPWVLTGCSSVEKSANSVSTEGVTTPVSIPYPAGSPILKLYSDIPGMLRLIGDDSTVFVTGSVEIGNPIWLPVTNVNANIVELIQKFITGKTPGVDIQNTWRLRVSDQIPFQMEIYNLKAEGHWNFSGLPITHLQTMLGTGKNAFTVDEPNPSVMAYGEFTCGSGELIFEGINNANCRLLNIIGGGGAVALRFSGVTPTEKVRVNIKGSTGTINITLPADIPSTIVVTGERQVIPGTGITRLGADGDERRYQTTGYRDALPLLIEIKVTGGTGNIYLDTIP